MKAKVKKPYHIKDTKTKAQAYREAKRLLLFGQKKRNPDYNDAS